MKYYYEVLVIYGSYHWQLCVIIPRQCTVVWFYLCHRKIPPALKNMLQE